MFFPIGDQQIEGGHKPLFAYSLILANVLIFLYEISLPSELSPVFIEHYGAIPIEVLSGTDLYTMLTSMFLHGGWMHLIGNMLFLWVFADNIEAIIGTFNFIVFYIIGGLVASAVHIFFNPYSNIPMVGASGAISAVMGAYLIMFPASKIKVLVLILFRSIYIPAIFFLGFWIIQQLVSGFGSIKADDENQSGVAWWAHIGGFLFGVLAGFIAKKAYGNRYAYREEVE